MTLLSSVRKIAPLCYGARKRKAQLSHWDNRETGEKPALPPQR
ncbi:hypothetical protein W04_0596 [Pseudoalteromonas sp. SW0106-04]|nr:hypothetical protein W04_0596 [Pseudoalteromonas sp. SW0106-04]